MSAIWRRPASAGAKGTIAGVAATRTPPRLVADDDRERAVPVQPQTACRLFAGSRRRRRRRRPVAASTSSPNASELRYHDVDAHGRCLQRTSLRRRPPARRAPSEAPVPHGFPAAPPPPIARVPAAPEDREDQARENADSPRRRIRGARRERRGRSTAAPERAHREPAHNRGGPLPRSSPGGCCRRRAGGAGDQRRREDQAAHERRHGK